MILLATGNLLGPIVGFLVGIIGLIAFRHGVVEIENGFPKLGIGWLALGCSICSLAAWMRFSAS